jgi:uncharacterized protein (TIGR03435 family)
MLINVVLAILLLQADVRPSFEVVSIKPSGFERRVTMAPQPNGLFAESVTTRMLIRNAYRVQEFQIEGGPNWITQDRFTVDAKAAGRIGPGQFPLMVQSMLEDRFKLKVHRETREMPVFALIPEKNGHKMKPAKDPDASPEQRGFRVTDGQIVGAAVSPAQFVNLLSTIVGRPVIDLTGTAGLFDVSLHWTLEATQPDLLPRTDSNALTIFNALEDQLGLKLNPQKGPVEFVIIDSVEKPSEN